MSRRSASVVVLLALLVPLVAFAAFVRQGPARAVFHAVGPAGFKLQGTGDTVQLEDNGTTLKIIVPLATLKTGIALRDHHMKDKYLQVSQYPNAVLEVPWNEIKLPADGASSQGQATGRMTIHGQTREVPFSYSITRRGNAYQVAGTAPLDITQFGIAIPSYMGVTVKKDITTEVSFQANRT